VFAEDFLKETTFAMQVQTVAIGTARCTRAMMPIGPSCVNFNAQVEIPAAPAAMFGSQNERPSLVGTKMVDVYGFKPPNERTRGTGKVESGNWRTDALL
jgi:hypothetical protein